MPNCDAYKLPSTYVRRVRLCEKPGKEKINGLYACAHHIKEYKRKGMSIFTSDRMPETAGAR